jgi:small multidrug resistance pump
MPLALMDVDSSAACDSGRRRQALFELLLAIGAEQIGTSAMKASSGFTSLPLTVLAIVGYALSMVWFGRSMRILPMGFAYALWVGAGMMISSLIGIFLFSELLTPAVLIGILMVFVGILVLNSSQKEAV